MGDKHQAHLIKESRDFIFNTSLDQLTAIKNNLISVTSTLPASNIKPERQLEL
jgi:hypothetical protein